MDDRGVRDMKQEVVEMVRDGDVDRGPWKEWVGGRSGCRYQHEARKGVEWGGPIEASAWAQARAVCTVESIKVMIARVR